MRAPFVRDHANALFIFKVGEVRFIAHISDPFELPGEFLSAGELIDERFQCLSMSTSFCYGCLFAARKEVQGVGLTWDGMWEESSPGDPMSLGLVLLMIAFDGLLYALIGFLVTRYTNSGRNSLTFF